jgi:cobalt/nickel transport system permease protein
MLGFAAREVRRHLSDSRVVLMAVLAALIFALQMLNFPVAGGTSGHFAGGAAAAIILGPWPAMVVMASVLAVQAFIFADGGVTALGANMLTMAAVAPLLGWLVYRTFTARSASRSARSAGAFAAGWVACVASALLAALLLWVSGRVPLTAGLGAMGGWHALIGIGEGGITAGLVSYLASVRPDLLAEDGGEARRQRLPVLVVLGAAALIATGLSSFASGHPDGLEYVYDRIGVPFDATPIAGGLAPHYVLPGISNETLAGIIAGVIGVVVTGALAYAALASLKARRSATREDAGA